MTDQQQGSDAQMSDEQLERVVTAAELARAAELEEDRKTDARPWDDDG